MTIPKYKVAIMDLYNNFPNQGMRCIKELLEWHSHRNNIDLDWRVFDVRAKNEIPDMDFDIYIGTGGPGSPLDSVNEEWDIAYTALLEKIYNHNLNTENKRKYLFLICHSFQIFCRHFDIGTVCKRNSMAFGVLPIHKTEEGLQNVIFSQLPDPFYSVDSRDFQVISPNYKKLKSMGAKILAIEKERPYVPFERCIMAVQFTDEILGTQFHPEADPIGMRVYLKEEEKKQSVINEHGAAKYHDMLDHLNDSDKIILTHNVIIPSFISQATEIFQEV
jgi:homoserine O-succinyltransferase